MLRLPHEGLDVKTLKARFSARSPSTRTVSAATVLLDFQVRDAEPLDGDEAPPASLAALVPLRTEL